MNSISKSMSFGGSSSTGGGLFGSSNNASNTGAANASSNLFGNNSGTTNTATAGTLFGASTSTPSAGGNLFGAPADKRARSGSLVTGGSNTSLFGASTATSNAAPAGTGLFGSAVPSNTTPAAGSGLFGSSTANNAGLSTGGSLFGNNANTGNTGGGLLGNNTSAAGGGGLFGSNTGATGGGLFGSANNATQNTNTFGTGTGLFGSNAANTTAPGPFGIANAANMQAQQQQQQQLLAQQQQQQQQQQKPSEADELSQHFMMIKECWDPNSPNFQFRHYFYNVCEPGQAHLYQCPPNTDPRLWEQAQQDNPDPSSLVPVVASGFDDLRKRVDSQSLQQQSYQERVTEISDKLRTILQKHHSGTSVRLADCRRRQADLGQRLLEFMKWLQVLRQADAPLTADEVILKERIDNLERELSKAGSVKQRLAELQDNTYRLQASARRRREMLGMAGNGSAGDNYEVADQSQLESVLHMLAEKQRGLTQLTQVVAQDKDALEEIERVNAARAEEVVKQQELHDSVRMARPQYAPW